VAPSDFALISGTASNVTAVVSNAITDNATNLAAGSAAALYVPKVETNGAEWGSHAGFPTLAGANVFDVVNTFTLGLQAYDLRVVNILYFGLATPLNISYLTGSPDRALMQGGIFETDYTATELHQIVNFETMAAYGSNNFATAAQGVKADNALTNGGVATIQYADILATAPSGSPATGYLRFYSDTVNGQEAPYYKQSDGGTYRIGRDLIHTVFGDAAAPTLTNGVAVYWTSNMTTTAHHADLAKANSGSTMPCQGVVVQGNITNGGTGTIMWQGRTPTGYLSSALSALPYGTPLYVSTTEAGGFQATEPAAPDYVQVVGFVNYNGAMDVRLGSSRPASDDAIERQWNLWPSSNSAVVAGAKTMRLVSEAIPAGSWTNASLTNNQYITFCSPAMGITELKAGFYTLTINMRTTTGGGDALKESAEVYIIGSNGVDKAELTPVVGTVAQTVTATDLEYIYRLSISTNTDCLVTDSISVRLKASGVGGTPDLIINSGSFTAPIPSGQFATDEELAVATALLLPKAGGTMTGNLNMGGNKITNAAFGTSYGVYVVPNAASNVIDLANGDLQVINLFGYGACTVYLPNSATNQFHSLTLQINPSTNTLTIATNGLVTVTLATNPVFNLPASTWTTCQFWKQYDTNYWKGASLQ
jgi:hypothetical protein